MTALKPIKWRHVVGVAAERYPSNLVCAHPDCSEPVQLRPDGTPTVHHIFPRSLTKSDSYFVLLTEYEPEEGKHAYPDPIPHAVGLCGSGTTGHHGDVEEHRAWIKLEDGEFVWYQRQPPTDPNDEVPEEWVEWVRVGPLNPQPGSREGKPKRKRTKKGTAERAARKTVSVRLPEGVDGDYWDELLEQANEIELQQPDTEFDPAKGEITTGKLLVAVLNRFTGRHGG